MNYPDDVEKLGLKYYQTYLEGDRPERSKHGD
jgi:hypothetical protein